MKKKNRVIFTIEDDHTLLNNLNGRVVIRDEFDGCPGRGGTVYTLRIHIYIYIFIHIRYTILTDPGRCDVDGEGSRSHDDIFLLFNVAHRGHNGPCRDPCQK